ncbi:hypothetical protein JCGZ_20149 [Jatropha curcas]|uniref:Uncharacterized protein n=1 Tax=Jatropha curcas TaxID=180498 RepID=A0A067K6R0_JATCU|nr:hypothetical protein JCGZ_20149 [Jatropha curcas]
MKMMKQSPKSYVLQRKEMRKMKKNETENITIVDHLLMVQMDTDKGVEDSARGRGIRGRAPSALATIAPSSSAPPTVEGDARLKLKIVKRRLHPSFDSSKAIMRIFKLHLEKDGWCWGGIPT